jgi:L-cysteine S-thiosulfotransferase
MRAASRFVWMWWSAWLALPAPAFAQTQNNADLAPRSGAWVAYRVEADAIAHPLGGLAGDAARGRSIVADRSLGLCLLCHSAPIAEERFQGDIGPDLGDAGSRLSEAQLRLRLVDGRRLNPASVMPAYHAEQGSVRVGSQWKGKPVLSAQQIEDVIAYLRTLRRPG